MQETRQHIVIVRNAAGEVVHTHQVIDVRDVAPLSEDELFEQAVSAARSIHES
jgi:hypothetical protein